MSDEPGRGDNLILIGFRGSGKTSVAKRIAALTGRAHVDTDDLVQTIAGRTIKDIFDTNGEAEFRRLETDAVRAATNGVRQVISVGGGAVISEYNRSKLRAAGTCVWLKAQPEILFRRIEADERSAELRPALTDAGGVDEVRQLTTAREQYYAVLADETVETDALDVNRAADRIIELLHWSDQPHAE